MLNFLMNDKEYEIQANMQVATILSQFDSNYIIGVLEDTINNQFNYFRYSLITLCQSDKDIFV